MEEKKRSKRSILLLIIIFLLIAVIISGSVTFAKYITSETTGSHGANVAKWGFTIEVDANDLFSDAYNRSTQVSYGDADIDVKADSENTNVVAPGTKGSMTFTIKGTAGVYSKLTISTPGEIRDVELVESNGGENSQPYRPVKWTLKKGDTAILTDTSLNEIVNELKGYSQEAIKPGQKLAHEGTYTIEWRWDLSEGGENDRRDTIIGQIANGAVIENCKATTNIKFELNICIEQIQSPEKPTA